MRALSACLAALGCFLISTPASACAPLPPIFRFPTGSARLDAHAPPVIERAFRDYRRERGARVLLVARTDGTGPVEANRRLARRRGEAVRAALVRRGIPARLIEIEIVLEPPRSSGGADEFRVVEVHTVSPPSGCQGQETRVSGRALRVPIVPPVLLRCQLRT